MDAQSIDRDDACYPHGPGRHLGTDAPRSLYLVGDPQILNRVQLSLICSVSCPGSVVINTFDAIRDVRDAGVIVCGGFHSPMELECLHFLMRGSQPVILCPACGIDSVVLGSDERRAVDEGRLTLLSIFDTSITKATPELASRRNDFVAALARVVFVPHAVPGGKAEVVARRALARGQAVLTFDDGENENLITAGVTPVASADLAQVALKAIESHSEEKMMTSDGTAVLTRTSA